MGLQLSILLTYAGAILLLLLLGKIFLWPLKLMFKLVVSSIIGGALILVLNVAAAALGLVLIPLNLLTALVVGVLGLPGAVLLILFFVIL